ncbi:diguanylate cyclase (GGDEF) domain-containing protein [Lachnospiraceae bacterium NE2001]|nr:diguanylate cyclase (GGDEF) domain-containing protein [Lachnospiraceae bacterium NE2001]SEQ98851.1 diguanylate cyclase (GGDEF) domain-containing protein [Lachnospiraceae bacterium NE2001]
MGYKMNTKKLIVVLLLLAMVISALASFTVQAEEKEHKVVRVGWYDSSFNYYDEFGRRCGIDFEYLQKISAYTGWTYEYVEDSWPNLLDMLENGEIDILSDVSYKEEREEYMLYPELPMGTESYYIFVSADNREIKTDDYTSLNGKRIGVNKDSLQQDFLEAWIEKYDIDVEVVLLSVSENESMDMVFNGELDGYASIFDFDTEKEVIPYCRIGGADYYYAVNKDRSDLLTELNMALSQIQDEDPYFNQKITDDRLYGDSTNTYLSITQEDWLKEHGPIRVGYRDDYLPFCDEDDETGELTGALKNYLTHAEITLDSKYIEFETISYDSTKQAIEALEAGEVDCIFPVYFNAYDADQQGLRLSDAAMKTEMVAIMRQSDDSRLSEDSDMTIAVNEGMMNIENFIMDNFPYTNRKSYQGLDKCYKAVADKDADGVLVSSYRILPAEDTLDKYKLCSVPTGESMPFSFGVKKWDTDLYFLLNKTVKITDNEDMDAALASYMKVDQKVSYMKFLKENWLIVICILILIFAIVIFLLVQKMKAERTAAKQRRLLMEAEEIADLKQTITSLLDNMPGMNFTKDAETGEYLACNQAFAEYAHKKDPSEVVGLTPKDLFDEKTAKRFIEDDKMALSMDEPYIFFDDMKDADGTVRQIKTTKLKYSDANGRLCVLGMFLDVTDNFRISRDDAKTKDSYEKAKNSSFIFSHIAQALAYGYLNLYYIDVNTEEFIEYRTNENGGGLTELRRGWHFFEACLDEIEEYVYPEDKEAIVKAMDRKTLVAALDQNDPFMMTLRIIRDGEPRYVSLNATRMRDDDRYIILSLTDIDEEMKQRNAAQKILEEQGAYNRITALAGDFFGIYVVVPETGQYRELSATAGFDAFELPGEGDNFFEAARKQALAIVYPEDQNRFLSMLSRENVLKEIEQSGIYTLSYRLVTDGEPRYVQLKAAMVEEAEGTRLIIGINDIDAQVRQEEEYGRRLAQARIEANIDALTGVKNRNAYRVYEERINAQIEVNRAPDFAITILDVNDLKKVNDTQGHKAGDQYLRDACRIICTTFKRSPVFRVGGDEFCVLSQGDDYAHIDELVEQMNAHNDEAIENGGIVIAIGMARYEREDKVAPVYERADQTMYENKSSLKARKKG